MSVIVSKFGGSSTAGANLLWKIRRIIEQRPERRYVVTFGDGSTTEGHCSTEGVIVVPFPKDASNVSFTIEEVTEDSGNPQAPEEIPPEEDEILRLRKEVEDLKKQVEDLTAILQKLVAEGD